MSGACSEADEAIINQRMDALGRWRRAVDDGLTSTQAAGAVGVSRATLYRWSNEVRPKSRRPHNCRKKTWGSRESLAVEEIRRKYPAWGRARIGHVLRHPIEPGQEPLDISDATVGRILAKLVERMPGLRVLSQIGQPRRKPNKRNVVRLRGAMKATIPGGVLQIDTMNVVGNGLKLKQFTAVDRVTRWARALVLPDATSASATLFLNHLRKQLPFPIENIQLDGGSEFMDKFEETCGDLDITLGVLPPRSPELNGRVERLHLTFRQEFYGTCRLPYRRRGLLNRRLRITSTTTTTADHIRRST